MVTAMNDVNCKIAETTLKRTLSCKKDFCCLTGSREYLCEVVSSVGSSMVQIKAVSQRSCKYYVPFGSASYCVCPTRNELFNRYKI
jgi:hypothetical protein